MPGLTAKYSVVPTYVVVLLLHLVVLERHAVLGNGLMYKRVNRDLAVAFFLILTSVQLPKTAC